jgi:hypothetical protein
MKNGKKPKELTEQQKRMGIATRNKQNKILTNRILAEKASAERR